MIAIAPSAPCCAILLPTPSASRFGPQAAQRKASSSGAAPIGRHSIVCWSTQSTPGPMFTACGRAIGTDKCRDIPDPAEERRGSTTRRSLWGAHELGVQQQWPPPALYLRQHASHLRRAALPVALRSAARCTDRAT